METVPADGRPIRLLAVATRLLDDRGSAEDVVQDTFVTVWTRASPFPALRTSPMAWLTSIARNRAIDLLRRRRPEVPLQWQDTQGEAHQHDVPDQPSAPLEQLLARQSDNRLGDCLARIEPERRQAVALAYYEGLTHEELAQRRAGPCGCGRWPTCCRRRRPRRAVAAHQGAGFRARCRRGATRAGWRAAELAVSVEPAGRLPAAPSGAFVYRGLCGKLWPVKPAAPAASK